MNDEDLVIAYRKGDEKALKALIERYLRPIFGFVYSMVGTKGDAEDITQDVMVSAWRHLDSFDTDRKFRTWIYAIAKNASFNWIKKKKPLVFSSLAYGTDQDESEHITEAIPSEDPPLESRYDEAMRNDSVREAIRNLNPIYSVVLLLYYIEGFTLQEIATMHDIPINTVKSRHRRALEQIKEHLVAYAPKYEE